MFDVRCIIARDVVCVVTIDDVGLRFDDGYLILSRRIIVYVIRGVFYGVVFLVFRRYSDGGGGYFYCDIVDDL